MHMSVTLAENLCRRMADVELYASYIAEAQKNPAKVNGAILIGTLLEDIPFYRLLSAHKS